MSQFEPPINPYASPVATGGYEQVRQFFGSDAALRKVASGLNLVYWSIGVSILAAIGSGILGAILGPARVQAPTILGTLVVIGLTTTVMGIVGKVMCLAVPPQTGAQGLIISAVVLEIFGNLGGLVARFSKLPPEVATPFFGGVSLLGIIGAVLFVLFMRKLALYIGRPELARKASSILIVGGLAVVAMLMALAGVLLAQNRLMGGREGILLVFGAIGGLLMLAGGLMYIGLLARLRDAILGKR